MGLGFRARWLLVLGLWCFVVGVGIIGKLVSWAWQFDWFWCWVGVVYIAVYTWIEPLVVEVYFVKSDTNGNLADTNSNT